MIKRNSIFNIVLMLAPFACRKPYEPAVIKMNLNYLVIDGVINAGPNGVTSINLSRTKNLADTLAPNPEAGAQVIVEAESGGSFVLASQGNGSYVSTPQNLNASVKYRLKITTHNGSVYQSDYVPVKQTPPIDSITWKQKLDSTRKDVTIYAHTHDPQKNTLYYRWDYVETWQYHAPLSGSLGLDNNRMIFYIDSTTQINTCWGTTYSTNISIATSEALGQDVISYAPVATVNQADEKIGVRYSVNVKQYALTKEAYMYWDIIKKSTQQTGSIFDPQPSQVLGNLHCISNPSEPVIGFASASYVTEKRIFIDNRDLSDWVYPNAPGSECKVELTPTNQTDFRIFDYPDTAYMPYYFISNGPTAVARKICLDCRRRGGTNLKPVFWQ